MRNKEIRIKGEDGDIVWNSEDFGPSAIAQRGYGSNAIYCDYSAFKEAYHYCLTNLAQMPYPPQIVLLKLLGLAQMSSADRVIVLKKTQQLFCFLLGEDDIFTRINDNVYLIIQFDIEFCQDKASIHQLISRMNDNISIHPAVKMRLQAFANIGEDEAVIEKISWPIPLVSAE